MPSLSNHQSREFTKILLIGDSKCLSGDTIVKVTRGNSRGKAKSLRELYQSGDHHNTNYDLETFLLCDLGGYVGLNQLNECVFSGVKDVFSFTTIWRTVNATMEHRFLTDEGWLTGEELASHTSTWVAVWDRMHNKKQDYPRRAVIYSVPFHPYANQHNIGEYGNYKRITRARAIVEAHMNNLSLDEFITRIRYLPAEAEVLHYVPQSWDIHHINGDRTDDRIENLKAIPEAEHVEEHEEIRLKTAKATHWEKIESIIPMGKVDTYDISMQAPYNNFVANGFIVHNSGKTGALVSLVKAGYKLRILDYDNGLDVLKQYVSRDCKEKIENVEFLTIRDKRKATPLGPVIDGVPKAFVDGVKMLDRWKYKDVDLGVPATWGADCILVIDSLTFLSDAAFDWRESLAATGGSSKYDRRAVYKDAQDAVENILGMLTGDTFKTNVIVIAHVKYMEQEDGVLKGYPVSVGSALSPVIPRYFNNYFRFVTKGGKRKIQTKTSSIFDLANAKPFDMPDEFDIENGLAEIFQRLRK